MRILFLVATVLAVALARPETYRETEDFKYSRSSSDEGTKSGFYGAQRGNMAGNYERAHNMDSLAQHQMSGAVNQVEGELGDVSKTQAGSVYTAANSRGVYGSGRYHLSNLQGRNFGESSTADSSHSSISSAYNQQAHNSDWRSQSQRTGYGASSHLGQSSLHTEDAASGYGTSNYGTSHSNGYNSASGYRSQSGYNSLNNYDQSNLNQHSSTDYGAQAGDQAGRYTIVTPVRLVGRPGTQIAIPVYGQAYDTHRASSLYDQHSSNSHSLNSQTASSAFDQNAINSEAEVLTNQQHVGSVPTVPVADGKHYSSSYNYRKAWERHSETTDLPALVAPTVSPLPKHSELYEDTKSVTGSDSLLHANSHNSYTGSAYNSANRYNSQVQSHAQTEASQSRHHSDYSSQYAAAADANSDAYSQIHQGTYGIHGSSPNLDSQPKSYQSSYSYHKSWEKQGDPYVIIPPTNGDASQRIVSGVKNHASSQHGSQSHQHYSQGSAVDCDSLCRYRRSVRLNDYYQQNQGDLGQQAHTGWEENLDQQTQHHDQPEKLEDLGQQTHPSWGDLQQQSKSEKLEDLGQQTQRTTGNYEQSQHHQNLEHLGQQTHQSWDNFHHQSGLQKLEDLGHQTQQPRGDLQQQNRPQKLEDLGQKTQQSWEDFQQQHKPQKLEDLGQQTQGKWHDLDQGSNHNLEDLGQQMQQTWDNRNIAQQVSQQNLEDLGQQTQGLWDEIETSDQQSQQNYENLDNLGQQTHNEWDNKENLGQQTQQIWDNLGNMKQETKHKEDLGQQTQNSWDFKENLGQEVQTQWNNINTVNKSHHTYATNTEQQTQTQLFIHDQQMKPNRVHAEDNTKYFFNHENSHFDDPDDPAFWGLAGEQRHEDHHYFNQQHSYNTDNSYFNSQRHGASWQDKTNKNNMQTTNNNPLQSLWDKIDNMEQQSEQSSKENQQHTGYDISQHSYNAQENVLHHNWENGQRSYNQTRHETHYVGNQSPFGFENTVQTNEPKDDQQRHESTTKKPKDDDLLEKPEPAEIGRGDIGAEDDLPSDTTAPKTASNTQTYTTHIKPEKAPEEIEALSLSRGTEKATNQADSLTVLSLSQQKLQEDQSKKPTVELNKNHISGSGSSTTSTTHSSVINGQYNHNLDQQNVEQEMEHFRQQKQNLPQFQHEGQQGQSFDQQSTGKELIDFGQQNQDLGQQHVQQLENFAQVNLDQQQTGKELEDFGQQSTGQEFGQQSQNLNQQHVQQLENFAQVNLDQQQTGKELEDFGQQSTGQEFGQQSQNLNQQHVQQLENFAQVNLDRQQAKQELEDFGQQSQDINQQNLQQFDQLGQQTQDLSQQNLQQFENLGQNRQTFEQQNTGQQLIDFGQQTQDLNQENLQPFVNFGKQSQQNKGQELENLGQQSQDLNQESLKYENLHHSQNIDQPQAREYLTNSNIQPIEEQKITPASNAGSQAHPKDDVEIVPPLVTTSEKPGFWKSVGNKFVSAKDTVSSWFKRS